MQELQQASAQLEMQGPRSDRRARAPERAAAPAGAGARAGVGREVAVPRQRLARVPHAAQRHPRLLADADGRLLRAAVAKSSRAPCSASTPTASTWRRSSTTCSTSSASRPAACRCRSRSSRSQEVVREVMEELQGVIAQSTAAVHVTLAARPAATQERPAEAEADSRQPAEQRVEVHEGRQRRNPRAARTRRRAASPERARHAASASRPRITRASSSRSSRPSASSRGRRAAPASGWRSRGGWRGCSAATSASQSALGAGSTFTVAIPVRVRTRAHRNSGPTI